MRIKIFRLLVCLVVICAMVVNVSPIRAEASAVGTLAGAAVGTVVAVVGISAIANALGIRAGSSDSDFYELVDTLYSNLSDWIVNDALPIFALTTGGVTRTYFPEDLVNDILQMIIGAEIVTLSFGGPYIQSFLWMGASQDFMTTNPRQNMVCGIARYIENGTWKSRTVAICQLPGSIEFGNYGTIYTLSSVGAYYAYVSSTEYTHSSMPTSGQDNIWTCNSEDPMSIVSSCPFLTFTPTTPYDLALGDVKPSTYAIEAYSETAVMDDQQNWYVPVTIPNATDLVVNQEQFKAQSGTTSQEVIDVLTGSQTVPGTGSGTVTVPDNATLKDILTGVLALPQSIAQAVSGFFANVVSAVQAIPAVIQAIPVAITDFFTITAEDLAIPVTWTDFFPFCIPWDIYELVTVLDAEPEAPHFVFDVDFPYMDEPWHIDIDFSAWDPVALVLRRLELLLFVVGLAMATRNYYIRG